MIEIWIPVAFIFGVIGSALVFRPSKTNKELETRNGELARHVHDFQHRIDELNVDVEDASWSLGGRIFKQNGPPRYNMPPGQPNTGKCDDARLAWMGAADVAAKALRTAGQHAVADAVYPLNVEANQTLGRTGPST